MTWLRHFAHIPATLRLVFQTAPGLAVVLGILTVLGALFPLGMAAAGKWIVDAVTAGDAEATARAVAIELAFVVGLAATSRGATLMWGLLGNRLSIEIHLRILHRAQALELRHYEDPGFYDRLTRARREASSRPLSVVTGAFGLAQNLLGVLGTAGLLLGFSPWVVVLLLLAGLPAALAEMRFGQRLYKLRNWRAPETRRLNYFEHVLATDRNAKEVALLGLGPMFIDRYRTLAWTFFHEDRALVIRRTAAVFSLSLLGTAAYYGSYAWMALSAAAGALTLGQLTFYVALFRQGQGSFQAVLGSISSIYEDNLYMSNLFGFLDDPMPPAPDEAPIAEPRDELGIRFANAGFRYPGSERWALRGVDLFIPAGSSVALVGHNGAGKTTMIKLLTGLYAPTEGAVLLDGTDVRSWDRETLRRRFAVVFQDFVQYQLPVGENVAVGDVEHLADRPRIGRAVEAGGASEVVSALPKGLDQPLGRWFDDGMELSGGQWQKIALARSFVREEADVLILDEPTAALDAEAEHKVFERFKQLTAGRTSVLVSHRFPTVRMADYIAVLDGGMLVEEGTHEELLEANGRYAGLFKLQAAGYL